MHDTITAAIPAHLEEQGDAAFALHAGRGGWQHGRVHLHKGHVLCRMAPRLCEMQSLHPSPNLTLYLSSGDSGTMLCTMRSKKWVVKSTMGASSPRATRYCSTPPASATPSLSSVPCSWSGDGRWGYLVLPGYTHLAKLIGQNHGARGAVLQRQRHLI